MVNNEDIYVLTEPTLYSEHSVLVEEWFLSGGQSCKRNDYSELPYSGQSVEAKLPRINSMIILLYYHGHITGGSVQISTAFEAIVNR